VPPHDNAAVDGYAVFFDDLRHRRAHDAASGRTRGRRHPLDRPVRRGVAIRIFTGAPMPDGPDTVFMQEDCVAIDDQVRLPRV